MNYELNASSFTGTSLFVHREFCAVLECCINIYREYITSNKVIANNEEKIRDVFFEKLDDDKYRSEHKVLLNYHFEREPQEKTGFLDIKVKTLKPYRSTKAFYVIECKRLNGKKSLNAEYVKNGICRFVTNYYSSFFDCNAMFGFVVESVDLQSDVIDNINSRLNSNYINAQNVEVNANAIQQLTYTDFANGYQYSYTSKHRRLGTSEITLYHLMFDFSQNIQQ